MDAKGAILAAMDTSHVVLRKYLDDLSDADLMRRPSEGSNHLAWQLGHLISSEVGLLNMVSHGKGPELPEGFAERHAKTACGNDDAAHFNSKQEYLELFERVNLASRELLAAFPENELDSPGPERFRAQFPTMGSLWILIATHPLMHAGQFAVARRLLGKPIVI